IGEGQTAEDRKGDNAGTQEEKEGAVIVGQPVPMSQQGKGYPESCFIAVGDEIEYFVGTPADDNGDKQGCDGPQDQSTIIDLRAFRRLNGQVKFDISGEVAKRGQWTGEEPENDNE